MRSSGARGPVSCDLEQCELIHLEVESLDPQVRAEGEGDAVAQEATGARRGGRKLVDGRGKP